LPIVTALIIAVNIFVFYLQTMSADQTKFILRYALTPSDVNLTDPRTLTPFITSMFLHGGFFHILSNMWFLWVFGDNIEAHLGRLKYIMLFFISGVAGSIAQYMVVSQSSIPMLGASGAVSGILGSYVVLFPGSRIKTVMVLFFYITIIEIPALIYIFYWFIIQLFQGFLSLPLVFQTGGVAFFAHIAGFLTGFYMTKKISREKNGIIDGEIIG
jgi:membrane associated rhomboid family serine protease